MIYMELPNLGDIKIKQLWILRNDGLCLFQQAFTEKNDDKLDTDIFSGFITAISTFATEMAQSSVKKIALSNMVLHQYRKKNLIVCMATEREVKNEDMIFDILDKIAEMFIQDYKNAIESTGLIDISVFEDFNEKLNEMLNISMKNQVNVSRIAQQQKISNVIKKTHVGELKPEEAADMLAVFLSNLKTQDKKNKERLSVTLKEIDKLIEKSDLDKHTQKKLKTVSKKLALHMKVGNWLIKI